jgi:hypothetical protein
MLASAVLALASCKDKASSGGESNAGATGATASSPTPSAAPAPVPSAAPPVPAVVSSLMGFEGEIDMMAKGSDPDKPAQPVNMLVRGDKLRLDVIPGTEATAALGKGFLLVRVADKKLDVVAEARKQVVEIDLSNPETMKGIQKASSLGAHEHNAKQQPPTNPSKVTKTGNKETVAGYSCEDWEITGATDNKKKASLCVANLPSTFFHIPLTGVPVDYGFAMELVDGKHFPLRIVSYDEHTGAESARLEVTKLDAHPVDAAKLEIPAGYQTVDMMQMIQALSAGPVPGVPSGIPGMPPGLPGQPQHRPNH